MISLVTLDAANVMVIDFQNTASKRSWNICGSFVPIHVCIPQIAGIWHTSVVVGGFEYFYGGGVQKAMAGSTPYGHPVEVVDLG